MKKLLLIYGAEATQVATTWQYVDAFRQHSRFKVEYLCIEQCPSEPVDLSRYDAVWVNYCAGLALDAGYRNAIPEAMRISVASFRGPKLVAPQDEYDGTNRLRGELRRLGATAVVTCVPPRFVEYAYPRDMFPDLHFETVLTGYVPDELLGIDDILPLAERPIVIGYRGRDLGARYGELARQKAQIGLRVRDAALARDIPCDIAVGEESRIYGAAWFDFIKSCRVMLGSESGSNVFDFDGSIAALYKKMKATDPELSYEKFQPLIAEREKEVDMAQISPRVFEAAALRTAMVLFRGRYSGLIEPDVHYIALEPDYSNLEEVLDRTQDVSALEAMTDRAHRDLVASGKYSYRTFVRQMDGLIESEVRKRARSRIEFVLPELPRDVVTSKPVGNDPYLRAQLNALTHKYEVQGRHLTKAYHDTDRLLAEVRSYGDALNRVSEEMRALEAQNKILRESIRALIRHLLRAVRRRLIQTMKVVASRARSGCTGARLDRIPPHAKPD
jgi:hypothetical protein